MSPDPKTMKKAMQLFENKNIEKTDQNTFQVKSLTNPDRIYQVVGNKCNCKGFKNFYVRHKGLDPTCSHVEAVKIFKQSNGL